MPYSRVAGTDGSVYRSTYYYGVGVLGYSLMFRITADLKENREATGVMLYASLW